MDIFRISYAFKILMNKDNSDSFEDFDMFSDYKFEEDNFLDFSETSEHITNNNDLSKSLLNNLKNDTADFKTQQRYQKNLDEDESCAQIGKHMNCTDNIDNLDEYSSLDSLELPSSPDVIHDIYQNTEYEMKLLHESQNKAYKSFRNSAKIESEFKTGSGIKIELNKKEIFKYQSKAIEDIGFEFIDEIQSSKKNVCDNSHDLNSCTKKDSFCSFKNIEKNENDNGHDLNSCTKKDSFFSFKNIEKNEKDKNIVSILSTPTIYTEQVKNLDKSNYFISDFKSASNRPIITRKDLLEKFKEEKTTSEQINYEDIDKIGNNKNYTIFNNPKDQKFSDKQEIFFNVDVGKNKGNLSTFHQKHNETDMEFLLEKNIKKRSINKNSTLKVNEKIYEESLLMDDTEFHKEKVSKLEFDNDSKFVDYICTGFKTGSNTPIKINLNQFNHYNNTILEENKKNSEIKENLNKINSFEKFFNRTLLSNENQQSDEIDKKILNLEDFYKIEELDDPFILEANYLENNDILVDIEDKSSFYSGFKTGNKKQIAINKNQIKNVENKIYGNDINFFSEHRKNIRTENIHKQIKNTKKAYIIAEKNNRFDKTIKKNDFLNSNNDIKHENIVLNSKKNEKKNLCVDKITKNSPISSTMSCSFSEIEVDFLIGELNKNVGIRNCNFVKESNNNFQNLKRESEALLCCSCYFNVFYGLFLHLTNSKFDFIRKKIVSTPKSCKNIQDHFIVKAPVLKDRKDSIHHNISYKQNTQNNITKKELEGFYYNTNSSQCLQDDSKNMFICPRNCLIEYIASECFLFKRRKQQAMHCKLNNCKPRSIHDINGKFQRKITKKYLYTKKRSCPCEKLILNHVYNLEKSFLLVDSIKNNIFFRKSKRNLAYMFSLFYLMHKTHLKLINNIDNPTIEMICSKNLSSIFFSDKEIQFKLDDFFYTLTNFDPFPQLYWIDPYYHYPLSNLYQKLTLLQLFNTLKEFVKVKNNDLDEELFDIYSIVVISRIQKGNFLILGDNFLVCQNIYNSIKSNESHEDMFFSANNNLIEHKIPTKNSNDYSNSKKKLKISTEYLL
ncbi:hypothetical protein EDEG_00752 [Edhazardia aedis USNM 41457]|uniref:Uncharacterized protein n=1 Tax=Edhazardia aedis (strain USNM 41457) TaxID=1003232 RepID=J9DBP0_EDHAE|nr:hypothetical protein EDEG_00752 [Edhazardia aedis USNM 41457]|eukprot:EJW05141.1 hypothetical protein EDEG_00752 [Edhazardia aedis USNM 41457]